jgi:hypothetical protein
MIELDFTNTKASDLRAKRFSGICLRRIPDGCFVIDHYIDGWTPEYIGKDGNETSFLTTFNNIGDCLSAAAKFVHNQETKEDKKDHENNTLTIQTDEVLANPVITREDTEIRTFDSGATRDTTEGKLSYVKALSSIVLQRYVQYLDKHRLQPDGSMREFNNWKKGIPEDTYFDSLGRHFVAAWLLKEGFPAEDNHGPVNIEDSLCAIIFNSMGWLHEILKDRKENANS